MFISPYHLPLNKLAIYHLFISHFGAWKVPNEVSGVGTYVGKSSYSRN